MNKKIKAVIFDLGGVLIDFRGSESIQQLSGSKQDAGLIIEFWEKTDIGKRFTKGRCSNEEFIKGALDFFKVDFSPEMALEIYKSWYHGQYEGALQIVEELRKNYKVGCLSNTNFIDVPRMRHDIDFDKYFDSVIFSCEVEMAKPEHEIYYYAAKNIGFLPENILFLDDNAHNIQAAVECGMQAVQAFKPEGVKKVLIEKNIIQ